MSYNPGNLGLYRPFSCYASLLRAFGPGRVNHLTAATLESMIGSWTAPFAPHMQELVDRVNNYDRDVRGVQPEYQQWFRAAANAVERFHREARSRARLARIAHRARVKVLPMMAFRCVLRRWRDLDEASKLKKFRDRDTARIVAEALEKELASLNQAKLAKILEKKAAAMKADQERALAELARSPYLGSQLYRSFSVDSLKINLANHKRIYSGVLTGLRLGGLSDYHAKRVRPSYQKSAVVMGVDHWSQHRMSLRFGVVEAVLEWHKGVVPPHLCSLLGQVTVFTGVATLPSGWSTLLVTDPLIAGKFYEVERPEMIDGKAAFTMKPFSPKKWVGNDVFLYLPAEGKSFPERPQPRKVGLEAQPGKPGNPARATSGEQQDLIDFSLPPAALPVGPSYVVPPWDQSYFPELGASRHQDDLFGKGEAWAIPPVFDDDDGIGLW